MRNSAGAHRQRAARLGRHLAVVNAGCQLDDEEPVARDVEIGDHAANDALACQGQIT
jgi:hypothetical protein